jgi:hypothetical protein
MSGINWLCLVMAFLRHCFERGDYLQGENLMSFDRGTTTLVHCSLLGGVSFGEPVVQVLSWWWMYCCCYGWNTVAGLFIS